MAALTIDIDDRLIAALRETAAQRGTTVDAIVAECLWQVLGREIGGVQQDEAGGTAGDAVTPGLSGLLPGRGEIPGRPVLR